MTKQFSKFFLEESKKICEKINCDHIENIANIISKIKKNKC